MAQDFWNQAPQATGTAPYTPAGQATTTNQTYGQFTIPGYGGPMTPQFNIGAAPTLDLPMFEQPDYQQAMSDPGYQFRLKQGQQALENSAAAAGTLNGGNTLRSLMDYNQNSASQEYQNVYNRALQNYNTNIGTREAMFAPQYGAWNAMINPMVTQGMAAFQRPWDQYSFLQDAYLRAALGGEQYASQPPVFF